MSEVGKALEAAAMAGCLARAKVNDCAPEPCSSPCVWCAAGASAAVAAFLRALPLYNLWGDRRNYYPERLADAVEKEAGHD